MDLFTQILLGASVVLSIAAVAIAWHTLLRAETPRLLAAERRLTELEVEVQTVLNAYNSLRESLKRINSRYYMREKRANGGNKPTESGLPDPDADPEGWRRAVQLRFPRGVFDVGRGNG